MTVSTIVPERPAYDIADPSSLRLDLGNPKPKDVNAVVEALVEAARTKTDLGPLLLSTGWHQITPEIAISLLLRNRPGANRKVDPATVYYYAQQMQKGQWKATGQPIIFDRNGILQDAQHRLYAGVISGETFTSFVVTDVEPIPNLFAYIDNGKVRNAAAALQTAGWNGVSPIVVRVLRIGEEVKAGIYDPAGATKLPRFSPADNLELLPSYPNAQKAAKSATSDWEEVVEYLGGKKPVVAYFGMRVIDLFGEEVADEFFDQLMAEQEGQPADDPIVQLRKTVDRWVREDKNFDQREYLAAMILAFNAWRTGQSLGRRWMLQVDEDFPSFDTSAVQAQAA